ncbi:ABC transporter permease [Ornithinimicrobium avium]|uniref:ABC transporter permease n=1 Tax=Ornithinimicrobium avium TaxID=2283195 RepID=A0A345NPR0_9MICO|nr:ABC transporter permease [Ornithinimicrobium avium]AXH97018.1 ABC transporter permease [Ornithinimicrobium avium]
MTSWLGWVLRRARASTGLLLTLLALVTATTAILAGAVGYSGAAATTAARQAITGAPPGEAGIRVQTREGDDPAAQDSAARGLIDEAFAPAPVSVQRTVVSPPRPVTDVDGTVLKGDVVVLASEALTPDDPDVGDRVDVVEGGWPQAATDPVQGLLHAGPAAEWGVGVGDTLEVDGTPVAVAGLWRPVDPGDAYWFGDPLVATGRDGKERGPLLVPPGSVAQLVDAPFVRWTVQPDAREIQPGDLAHLSSAAESLRSTLKTPGVDVRGVTVEGDLAPTAGTAAHNLATANALGVIPLSVLALVTMLSVIQLARLLATTREAQAQLLVARGATRTQVLVSTVGESAVVTVVGSTLGALAAWAVLQAVPAGPGQGGTVVRVALLTGLAVLVVLAAVAAIQVRRLTAGGTADISGRTRAATALATLVLVLGAAGVSWWQLRRNGSPLVTRDDGSLGTDLVAGAAPALLLAAAAVVAMALLGPLGRLVEALTRSGRSAAGHLAAAQVARRLPVYAVPAVLTVLAVGATTLSGLYAGTSAALRDNLAAVGQGAPVRATLEAPPKVAADGQVPPAPQLPTGVTGTTSTAPVWLDETSRLGDLEVPVTMAPAGELAQTVSLAQLPTGQQLVPVQALTVPTPAPAGVEIPPGTREVTVTVDVDLTADEKALEGVQAGFEQTVKDVMDGVFGQAQPDEAQARADARMMMDSQFVNAPSQTTWDLRLRFVDTTHGIYRTVDGGTVDLRMPAVTLPWTAQVEAGDQVEDIDYTRAEITQGGGDADITFALPQDTSFTLVGVDLLRPNERFRGFPALPPDVDAQLTARTGDGTDLFGAATAGWGSLTLASPQVLADIEAENAGVDPEATVTTVLPDGGRLTQGLTRQVPGELDTSGRTWTIHQGSDVMFPDDVTIAPGLEYVEDAAPPTTAPTPSQQEEENTTVEAAASTGTVPAALTAATASAAGLRVGDRAQLNAFGSQLPIEVVAVVPAVPGSLSATGVLLDRDAVAAQFVAQQRPLPYPTELWAMPDGWSGVEGAADARTDETTSTVVEELAGRDGVATVTGPGRVAVTDATSAARLVFWVASVGAVLLAVTGIGAVAATLLGHRRPEVAVLRALGMTPRSQARSRALELGGVVLASVALGLVASWLVGRAVVPELARSTALPGQASLPAQLLLEPGVWAALMGVGALVVLLVVGGQATRVRAQALDHDYREEIR